MIKRVYKEEQEMAILCYSACDVSFRPHRQAAKHTCSKRGITNHTQQGRAVHGPLTSDLSD